MTYLSLEQVDRATDARVHYGRLLRVHYGFSKPIP